MALTGSGALEDGASFEFIGSVDPAALVPEPCAEPLS